MTTMKVFQTLMLREWLQHHKGWLALALIPLGLIALLAVFGSVDLDEEELTGMSGAGLFLICTLVITLILLMEAMLVMAFQASSLARRDQQDRSIEFWLSLPVGQAHTLAAMLLMHVWLFPLMVLVIGLVGGLLVAPVIVFKGLGVAGFAQLPWADLALVLAAGVLRLIGGLLLAGVWALPFVLLLMAASAWLKRWGVPVLVAGVGIGGGVLKEVYGQTWLLDGVEGLAVQFGAALIPGAGDNTGFRLEDKLVMGGQFDGVAQGLMLDLQQRAADLASPWLLLALALSAVGAWAVLYRRQQGR